MSNAEVFWLLVLAMSVNTLFNAWFIRRVRDDIRELRNVFLHLEAERQGKGERCARLDGVYSELGC